MKNQDTDISRKYISRSSMFIAGLLAGCLEFGFSCQGANIKSNYYARYEEISFILKYPPEIWAGLFYRTRRPRGQNFGTRKLNQQSQRPDCLFFGTKSLALTNSPLICMQFICIIYNSPVYGTLSIVMSFK
jgi:hypothetical protein